MINKLQTVLKGQLTELSLATVIAGLVSLQTEIIPAVEIASEQPVNYAILLGMLLAVWGKVRRNLEAYKNH